MAQTTSRVSVQCSNFSSKSTTMSGCMVQTTWTVRAYRCLTFHTAPSPHKDAWHRLLEESVCSAKILVANPPLCQAAWYRLPGLSEHTGVQTFKQLYHDIRLHNTEYQESQECHGDPTLNNNSITMSNCMAEITWWVFRCSNFYTSPTSSHQNAQMT